MHDIYSQHVGRLPSSGAIKINSDANMAAGNQIGLGVVLRDDVGCVVAAAVRRLKARWGVEQAEVAVARMGVQIAKKLGHERIVLFKGFQLVIPNLFHYNQS